jgi:hypothetical protein
MANQNRTRENPLTTSEGTAEDGRGPAEEPALAEGFTLTDERNEFRTDDARDAFAEASAEQETYMDPQPEDEGMGAGIAGVSEASDYSRDTEALSTSSVAVVNTTPSGSSNGSSENGQNSGLKEQAKQATTKVLSRAGETLKSTLDSQKGKAAEGLTSITEALHQTGESLRSSGQDRVGEYAETFASQVDRFTNYLRDTDLEQIRYEVTDYARKNPTMFLGGAFLLGVAISRFLKSSESNRSRSAFVGATNDTPGTLVTSSPDRYAANEFASARAL